MLDEFYWLNKEDFNYFKCRVIESGGKCIDIDGDFILIKKVIKEILNLCLMKEEDLDDVKIIDVFLRDFLNFNFWFYWKIMFVFELWYLVMEMCRYFMCFVYYIGGLVDFSVLKFIKYN